MPWLTKTLLRRGEARLRALGLSVTYAKHIREHDDFGSSSVASRLEDLHAAFADPAVRCILCIRGGFNSNQLLRHIDYGLIKRHPKILCGFSDITALATAIHVKTGLVTYSGPNFNGLCSDLHVDRVLASFEGCLLHTEPFVVRPSPRWSDAHGPGAVSNRKGGHWILQEGNARGRLIGGNLITLNFLQGTAYFPDLRDAVLFIEDDYENRRHHFDAHLQSLLHQPGIGRVRGLVIGRFESRSEVTRRILAQCVASKPELRGMPIVANVDFGHTRPLITFPIGGTVKISAAGKAATIEILRH